MRYLVSTLLSSVNRHGYFNKTSTMSFCANLSFMFNEKPFVDRYDLAKDAGFKVVESGFPFGCSLEDVTNAKNNSGIEQILINIYTGDTSKGELGVTYDPSKQVEFRKNLAKTIDYAKALKCKFVHVMSGICQDKIDDVHWQTYESNLRYATEELKKDNLICLIEPINNHTVPNYFMNSYEKAVDIIKRIDCGNLRLMMDLFHLQHIKGDLTNNIKAMLPYVGHIQIAQVPNRNEPNTPGEIDYKYIIDLLKAQDYKGYIGLEYKPINGSKNGLSWINEYNYTL